MALLDEGADGRTVVETAKLNVRVVSFGIDDNGEVLVLAFDRLILRLVEAESGYAERNEVVPAGTPPPSAIYSVLGHTRVNWYASSQCD